MHGLDCLVLMLTLRRFVQILQYIQRVKHFINKMNCFYININLLVNRCLYKISASSRSCLWNILLCIF